MPTRLTALAAHFPPQRCPAAAQPPFLPAVPGTNQVLETLAYASTVKRSAAKIARDVEDLGASVGAKAGREVFSYTGIALRENVDGLVSVISEAITQPKLVDYEVKEGMAALASRLEAAHVGASTNPTALLLEGVHAAAYGSTSALGHALYGASGAAFEDVDASALTSFLGGHFTGSNTVVVASSESS